VSRDDPGRFLGQPEDPVRGRDHAVERAARVVVDERIQSVEEQVPGVDRIGGAEVDDGVAVRVCRRHVEGVDLLAVEVEGDRVAERDDRERCRRRGRDKRVPGSEELLHRHAHAHVVVSHDEGSRLPQVLVAAGVVAVPVGVEHEADRPVGERGGSGPDLVRQGRVLVVDEERPVRTESQRQVPAPAGDQRQAGGERRRLDRDLRRVHLLRGRAPGPAGEGTGQHEGQRA
jgi:hypothetical protein